MPISQHRNPHGESSRAREMWEKSTEKQITSKRQRTEDDDFDVQKRTSKKRKLKHWQVDSIIKLREQCDLLRQGLQAHWNCVCQRCDGLSVRLSLPLPEESQDETCLEVFFSLRSEAKINLKEAKIKIKDTQNVTSTSTLKPFSQICPSIQESLGQMNCLNLVFENGRFTTARPTANSGAEEQRLSTVSLTDFFQHQQMNSGSDPVIKLKGRRILALIIAKALLPFLETPWLQYSFNHSDIRFYQSPGPKLAEITRPFLYLRQIPTRWASPEGKPAKSAQITHPYPSVLALGVLLCELESCTPLAECKTERKEALDFNTSFQAAKASLEELGPGISMLYHSAIYACLNFDKIVPEGTRFGTFCAQRDFYDNVIQKLELELDSLDNKVRGQNSLEPHQNEGYWGDGKWVLRKLTQTNSMTLVHRPAATTISRSLFDAEVSDQLNGHPQSNQWIKTLQNSIHEFVKLPEGAPTIQSKPVKIAILDSGFCHQHPYISGNVRIKESMNFVDQKMPYDMQDNIGHGTHALGLLLGLATDADIYIAKVVNKNHIERQDYNAIAEAINHAAKEWEVDIISMSLGIREHNDPIIDAISNAVHSKILIFAAAANDGANKGRVCPAIEPSVFCVHSSDGYGNPSKFNPLPVEGDMNYCVLGEHVLSCWPPGLGGHDGFKALSGTSVATPIAAALAAMLLHLACQRDPPPGTNGELGPRLKRYLAMNEILRNMSLSQPLQAGYNYIPSETPSQPPRAGYNYIAPGRLLKTSPDGGSVYTRMQEIISALYVHGGT